MAAPVIFALVVESRSLTGLWQRLKLAALFLWCAVIGPILASPGATRARA